MMLDDTEMAWNTDAQALCFMQRKLDGFRSRHGGGPGEESFQIVQSFNPPSQL